MTVTERRRQFALAEGKELERTLERDGSRERERIRQAPHSMEEG